MYLRHLELKNFKNLSGSFEFDSQTNLLIYPNGWGKTNLLESIEYLSSRKSFRGLRDLDLFDWEGDDDFLKLSGSIRDKRNTQLDVIVSRENEKTKKVLKKNGANTNSRGIGSAIATFLYSPHNEDIVSSSPDVRRRQFDRYISEIFPQYSSLTKEYKYILKNRNKLLQSLQVNLAMISQLDYWNQRFVDIAEQIMELRLELLYLIEGAVGRLSGELYAGAINLEIIYSSKSIRDDVLVLSHKVRQNQQKEIDAGMSLYGPHRDDYEFLLNNSPLRQNGSRGQQRVAGIILILALESLFCTKHKLKPILLFDDILSELDKKHRENIMAKINTLENQVILTSSQEELFTDSFLKNSRKI